MRALTVALFFLSLTSIAQTTCLDPLACNLTEIGDCVYLDIDGLPCVTEGCAIPGACNFDPEADINDGSCEFTSCLGCTDETACNYEPEALYLDLSCIYYVDCNGVCGGDWIEDECGNCFQLEVELVIYTFETCGAEGRYGPSQEQLNLEYGEGSGITVINGIQHWTVPESGIYTIEVLGAAGGDGGHGNGGHGAKMKGQFMLTAGETLQILVGQQGNVAGNYNGGGGGGTFVAMGNIYTTAIPIIIAGGGGGGGTPYNHDGVTSESGQSAHTNNGPDSQGGVDGNGGEGGTNQGSGGGGGFYSDAWGATYDSAYGGAGFQNGGTGGGGYGGGFGGGGGFHFNYTGGGGGGGYSGGGGGGNYNLPTYTGGGGGSYNAGENQYNESGVNEGHGMVVIEFSFTSAPECQLGCIVEQACNFNPEATNDDGTCDFCFCGPGTAWDNLSEQCLIVDGSSDIDGDGCTNLSDLLDLLSDYGICDD